MIGFKKFFTSTKAVNQVEPSRADGNDDIPEEDNKETKECVSTNIGDDDDWIILGCPAW